MVWGHYDGPAIGHINRNEYPRNELDVHDDGTWHYDVKCCGPPG
jgi:hypothetical protein